MFGKKSREDKAAKGLTAKLKSFSAKADAFDPVAKAKEAQRIAKVIDAYANKYQLRPEHWAKLAQIEGKAGRLLEFLGKEGNKKLIQKASRIVDLLFLGSVVFLVGSTTALWLWQKNREAKVEKTA